MANVKGKRARFSVGDTVRLKHHCHRTKILAIHGGHIRLAAAVCGFHLWEADDLVLVRQREATGRKGKRK